jgi:hypothetical protein
MTNCVLALPQESCSISESLQYKLLIGNLLLNSHTEAMRLERFADAEYFYGLLNELTFTCNGSNC